MNRKLDKFRARESAAAKARDRHETDLLFKACIKDGKFDLRSFNLKWAELHGPVDDPSKSIQKRQKKQRNRTGQAVRDQR